MSAEVKEGPERAEGYLELLSRQPSVEQYHAECCSQLADTCVFFVTSTGYIGMATMHLAVGDKVALINGVAMPLLLRNSEGGKYQVVGPAFIDQMMGGVSISLDVEWSHVETQDIELI